MQVEAALAIAPATNSVGRISQIIRSGVAFACLGFAAPAFSVAAPASSASLPTSGQVGAAIGREFDCLAMMARYAEQHPDCDPNPAPKVKFGRLSCVNLGITARREPLAKCAFQKATLVFYGGISPDKSLPDGWVTLVLTAGDSKPQWLIDESRKQNLQR